MQGESQGEKQNEKPSMINWISELAQIDNLSLIPGTYMGAGENGLHKAVL